MITKNSREAYIKNCAVSNIIYNIAIIYFPKYKITHSSAKSLINFTDSCLFLIFGKIIINTRFS